MPEKPLELLDAVIEQLVLGRCLVRDELLKQRLVANQHVHEILSQILLLQLLAIKVEKNGSPYRQFARVDLNQGFQLISDHLVTLLMAYSYDHFDVLFVDGLKCEHLHGVGIEALDQHNRYHASHKVFYFYVVGCLLLVEHWLHLRPFDDGGKVQAAKV
jgi:hypothetical protein